MKQVRGALSGGKISLALRAIPSPRSIVIIVNSILS